MAIAADHTRSQSTAAKWGWRILLAISALLFLNGISWYFIGPGMTLSYVEQTSSATVSEFRATYPLVADSMESNARQVAIWFAAFGVMAFIAGLAGLRHGSRWAWHATWLVVAAPIAVGLNAVIAGGDAFTYGILVVGLLALAGQLLAGRGLAR